MKAQTAVRVTELKIHNPKLPPWPGERTRRNMAKATKKAKGSARQNTSKPKLSLVKAKRNSATRTVMKARRPASRWRNPLGGNVAGLNIPDIVGAGAGVLVNSAVGLIAPAGLIGIGLQWAVAVALAKFAPKAFAGGAGIGAGAIALNSTVNHFTNNAVANFFNGAAQRLIPTPPPAPSPGVGRFRGMAGLVDVPMGSRVFV